MALCSFVYYQIVCKVAYNLPLSPTKLTSAWLNRIRQNRMDFIHQGGNVFSQGFQDSKLYINAVKIPVKSLKQITAVRSWSLNLLLKTSLDYHTLSLANETLLFDAELPNRSKATRKRLCWLWNWEVFIMDDTIHTTELLHTGVNRMTNTGVCISVWCFSSRKTTALPFTFMLLCTGQFWPLKYDENVDILQQQEICENAKYLYLNLQQGNCCLST